MWGGGQNFSPRYIVDTVFKILMYFNNGDWAGAALIWIYLGAIIQALGIANFAHRISERYQMVVAPLFTLLIAYCNNFLANFNLIALASISIGVAVAFSFLSISFLIGKRRDYKKAWLFATCVIMCHVHEGIYCCAVIFLFLFVDCLIQRRILLKENWTIVFAVIALAVVVGPSLLTDAMDISNVDFVNIYASFRHPHHLVPSTWGTDIIYKTIWIDVCLFLLSVTANAKMKMEGQRFFVYEAMALVMAWIVAISLMYGFTEIKPIAFVATLFLSKFFKYVLLVALAWNVKSAVELREHGDYISSYLYIFFALFASSYELKRIGLIALTIFLVMNVEDCFISLEKTLIPSKILLIADSCFFIFIICVKQETLGMKFGSLLNFVFSVKSTIVGAMIHGLEKGLIIILVFFSVEVIAYLMKKSLGGYKLLCAIVCCWMVGITLLGRIVLYDNESVSITNGERALRASMGDDLYEIAEDFKEQTDITTEFLADPDDTTNTGWFQIVSQRNCYVVKKVIPSSKSRVNDWYNRYLQARALHEKNGEEIEKLMNSAGLEYVLIGAEYYPILDGAEKFSVFLRSTTDSFRVYRMN